MKEQSVFNTWATAVVILVPPEPPTTILTLLFLSSRTAGHIDDMGLLSEQDMKKFIEKNKTSVWHQSVINSSIYYVYFWVKLWWCPIHRWVKYGHFYPMLNWNNPSFFERRLLTWYNKVIRGRRNSKIVGNQRRTEVIHLIVQNNPGGIWHEFGAKTGRTESLFYFATGFMQLLIIHIPILFFCFPTKL